MELPERARFRARVEGPRQAKDLRSIEDSMRAPSEIGIGRLVRARLCDDVREPISQLSMTGRKNTRPTRESPEVDATGPARARVWVGRGDAALHEASTKRGGPRYAELWINRDGPTAAVSMADRKKRLPKRLRPKIRAVEPVHTRLCKETELSG